MKSIEETIEEMEKGGYLSIRKPIKLVWGNHEECKHKFIAAFQQVDQTLTCYVHLPEYDEIIDWMTGNQGKGLLLMGDVGRGKTNIIVGVIPYLLRLQSIHVRPVHAQDFNQPAKTQLSGVPESNLEYLLKIRYPIIDDLGTEVMHNNFGTKSEAFTAIINAAERINKPMFITTNLTVEQLLDRYGDRTLDRLRHLCRVIQFSGESLR